MIHFLADENFNNDILRGVLRRVPDAHIVRIQDTELAGKPDTLVLEWAAQHDYIVLSHDVSTMRGFFYDRVKAGQPVPGLFLVHGTKSIGDIVDSLEVILLISDQTEWAGELRYLPL
jgi:hypothetical protein